MEIGQLSEGAFRPGGSEERRAGRDPTAGKGQTQPEPQAPRLRVQQAQVFILFIYLFNIFIGI